MVLDLGRVLYPLDNDHFTIGLWLMEDSKGGDPICQLTGKGCPEDRFDEDGCPVGVADCRRCTIPLVAAIAGLTDALLREAE